MTDTRSEPKSQIMVTLTEKVGARWDLLTDFIQQLFPIFPKWKPHPNSHLPSMRVGDLALSRLLALSGLLLGGLLLMRLHHSKTCAFTQALAWEVVSDQTLLPAGPSSSWSERRFCWIVCKCLQMNGTAEINLQFIPFLLRCWGWGSLATHLLPPLWI